MSIPELPDDIIDLIIRNISRSRDLQSCSRVDRRWHPYAQSRLFATFEVRTHGFVTCSLYCSTKAKKLQYIVQSSPHIARHFRTLTVSLSTVPNSLCCADAVSFLLPQMTNLREIKLTCYGPPPSRKVDWTLLKKSYADLLLQCIRRSILYHISVDDVENFPVLLLDQVPVLISLRLHRASLSTLSNTQAEEGQSAAPSALIATSVLSLESFHFRSCDEDGQTASLLLKRLHGPDAGIFGRLRRLCFVVCPKEEALLVTMLRGSALSLRDLVLDIKTPTNALYATFLNLTSLETLVIKFYDITDIGQVPKDFAHLLRSLGKAGCPLRKLHLLMVPRERSTAFPAVHEGAWNELDVAILHWVGSGTLRNVYVGSTGLYYGKGTTSTIQKYLSGVAKAELLSVSSA